MVSEDERLGKYYPLAAGVGKVPFVPERYVGECRFDLGPHYPCKAADLFCLYRVSFVRHGAGSHLLFPEDFLDLTDLASLERSNLDADLIESGCHKTHPTYHLAVPVTLYHLV